MSVGRLWQRLSPAWRTSLGAYAAVRLFLLALAVLVVLVYPGTLDPQAAFRQHVDIPPVDGPVEKVLWGVWLRWDTLWYVRYARDGLLPADDSEYWAFWPLYPWLMRWLAPLVGGNPLVAGLLISNAALIGALVTFFHLAEMECGEQVARRATWYVVVFPSAFFLFAAYTESLFLLCSLGAFYLARRGRWGWSGLCAAAAAMLRIPGAFLLPAIAFEYLRQRVGASGREVLGDATWWKQTVVRAWPFLIMLAGIAFTPLYTLLFLRGRSLATAFTFHVDTGVVGGGIAFPGRSLVEALRSLLSGRFFVIQPFDLVATLLFLAFTVVAFLRLPLTYGLYMAVTMLALVCRSIPQHPLLSASRYVGMLFPAYLILGQSRRTPWFTRLVVYPSLLALAFLAAEFMIGGFVG